jgi:hypothetical protein
MLAFMYAVHAKVSVQGPQTWRMPQASHWNPEIQDFMRSERNQMVIPMSGLPAARKYAMGNRSPTLQLVPGTGTGRNASVIVTKTREYWAKDEQKTRDLQQLLNLLAKPLY